jgi:aryl-alcohol dehydrogenase-like predicted oxidoreductase
VIGNRLMKYGHLGRSGLQVSNLCLGTMNFATIVGEAASFAIMDLALERGINFFDTADVYGGNPTFGDMDGRGQTEEYIGRWFAQGGGRRDKVVLATKVYQRMTSDPWPNRSGLSALYIRRACEDSLRRLRTDHIDLYQMHHVDRETPLDEIWQAMELLIAQGKVLYVGASNHAGWHIVRANEAAARRHLLGLVSEQSLYHLLQRTVELEVLPACAAYGVSVLPWSPLAGGLLAGALRKSEEGRRGSAALQRRVEAARPQLKAYETFCEDLGRSPASVALAWLLANPVVRAPIAGVRTTGQLEDVLASLEIALDADMLAHLDAIFPGPGGPAPEAYAW